MRSRFRIAFWILAACLALAAGAFFFWLSIQPYGVVKPFLDSFFDKKGFETLKPVNFTFFMWVFRVLAFGLVLIAPVLLFWRGAAWREGRQFVSRLPQDFTGFVKDLKPSWPGLGAALVLLVIFIAGFVFRMAFINQPIGPDESYSYVAFASGTFQDAISDYHLPNNHVFHTILMYLSTHLLGVHLWTVRLPAFLAGLLLVPFSYLLAARLYKREVGQVTAALVAAAPVLINYSSQARGYSILALISVASLILGYYLLEHKNRVGWGVLSLLGAFGFYNLPIMLLPIGVLYVWMSLSHLFSPTSAPYRSRLEFFIYLAASAIGMIGLTALAYLPIFVRSGFGLFFGNQFVASLSWRDFPATLMSRLQETWAEWTGAVPPVLVGLIIVGLFGSLFLERRTGKSRFPMQVAALAWIVALLLLRRYNAWARIWVFLVPLVLMWAAAGLVGMADLASTYFLKGRKLAPAVVAGALLLIVINSAQVIPTLPEKLTYKGDVERVAIYMVDHLQSQDKFLVSFPDDSPLWYYVMERGISFPHFQPELGFERVLALVDTSYNQTLDSVVKDRHLSLAALDCGNSTPLQVYGVVQLYECKAR